MLARRLLACTALFLAGCYTSHELVDAGRPRDAGPRRGPDGCVPQREVPRSCGVRWARAIGTDVATTYPAELAVGTDGSTYALLGAAAGARIQLDGHELAPDDGTHVLLGLAPDGALRWGRDRRYELLSEHGGVVLTGRTSPTGALEYLRGSDGALLREEHGDVRWVASVQAACARGCTSRELRVAQWVDRIDVGRLGVVEADRGLTVLLQEDGVVRWHWTTTGVDLAPIVLAPRSGLADDGSAMIAIRDTLTDPDGELCLSGVPCIGRNQTLLVRLGPSGEPDQAVVGTIVRWFERTDDGGAITSGNAGIVRYDRDLARDRIWRYEASREWTGPLAVDSRTGLVRATLGVPERLITILGTDLEDCLHPHPWRPTHGVMFTLDPSTGEPLRTELDHIGTVRSLRAHPEGGVVVAIHVDRAPRVELCGRILEREDDPGAPIDVVIAHLD